jgi:hypothetical protein
LPRRQAGLSLFNTFRVSAGTKGFAMTWSQKLQQPQWKTFRLVLIQKHGPLCDDCGQPGSLRSNVAGLDVHHCWYEHGREPWEYPENCFLILCRGCHGIRQKIQNSAMVTLGSYMRLLSVEEMKVLVFELVAKRTDLETPVNFSFE